MPTLSFAALSLWVKLCSTGVTLGNFHTKRVTVVIFQPGAYTQASLIDETLCIPSSSPGKGTPGRCVICCVSAWSKPKEPSPEAWPSPSVWQFILNYCSISLEWPLLTAEELFHSSLEKHLCVVWDLKTLNGSFLQLITEILLLQPSKMHLWMAWFV